MEIKQILNTDKNTCNIQEDYTNPDNLNYYLIDGYAKNLKMQVIKQKFVKTSIGNIELSIIGSSHCIRLGNVFTELLTCTNEKVQASDLIVHYNSNPIKFYHKFEKLQYKTSIFSERKASKSEFAHAEQEIYNQNNEVKHFFYKNTALTAIKLSKISEKEYRIETWHSYPEYLDIVYSATELLG